MTLGLPITLTPEQIDAAFAPRGSAKKFRPEEWLVLDEDLEPALDYWHLHAPVAYRGILDGDNGWTFDERTQRYVSDSGSRLRADDVKRMAVLFALALELDLEDAARRAAAGTVAIDEWQAEAASLLKRGYVVMGALGAGGIGRVTDGDRLLITGTPETDARVGVGLRDALDRLERFGGQLGRRDEAAHTSDQVVARAGSYADGTHAVYEEVRRASHGRALDDDGNPVFLLERNVLDDKAHHCHPDALTEGCPQLTDLGWVPIGALPAPGLRTCRGNCRCSLEYSGVDGEGEPLAG